MADISNHHDLSNIFKTKFHPFCYGSYIPVFYYQHFKNFKKFLKSIKSLKVFIFSALKEGAC